LTGGASTASTAALPASSEAHDIDTDDRDDDDEEEDDDDEEDEDEEDEADRDVLFEVVVRFALSADVVEAADTEDFFSIIGKVVSISRAFSIQEVSSEFSNPTELFISISILIGDVFSSSELTLADGWALIEFSLSNLSLIVWDFFLILNLL